MRQDLTRCNAVPGLQVSHASVGAPKLENLTHVARHLELECELSVGIDGGGIAHAGARTLCSRGLDTDRGRRSLRGIFGAAVRKESERGRGREDAARGP